MDIVSVIVEPTFLLGCFGFIAYEVFRIYSNRRNPRVEVVFDKVDGMLLVVLVPTAGLVAYFLSGGVERAALFLGLTFVSVMHNLVNGSTKKGGEDKAGVDQTVQFDDIAGSVKRIGLFKRSLLHYFRSFI